MIVIELTDMKFTNTDLEYKDILFLWFSFMDSKFIKFRIQQNEIQL